MYVQHNLLNIQEINIIYVTLDYNVLGLTYVYNIHAIEPNIFLKKIMSDNVFHIQV